MRRPITAYQRHFHNRSAFTMVPTQALRSELALQGFERSGTRGDTVHFCRVARRLTGKQIWVRQIGERGRADARKLDWSQIVGAVEATSAFALLET